MNWTKLYILAILISLTSYLNAQTINDCKKFDSILEYLNKENNLKEYFKVRQVRFDINPKIDENAGTPFLIADYYAYKLGLTIEEFNSSDTSLIYPIYRDNQDKLLNTDTSYVVDCLKSYDFKRPNIYLGFSVMDNQTISVGISKITNGKKHTFGKYYIFIFDNTMIKKVIETSWIE